MVFNWIEISVAALFAIVVLTLWVSRGSGWLEPRLWRNAAVVACLVMSSILVYLTVDSVNAIRAGSARVPPFSVINQQINLEYDAEQQLQRPTFGATVGLFGQIWSPADAAALVNLGKLTFQGRDCMDCHTLLGNGAYFAPDLTRAWLDPRWETMIAPMVGAQSREDAMARWLENSDTYATGPRRMPNLKLTAAEVRGLVAFLKWMSGIDTNGFPPRFGMSGS